MSAARRWHLPHKAVSLPALVVYGVAVFLANWLIRNAGPVVLPDGTHLVPVGFGLFAPSGALAAGVVFVARDVVQRTAGRGWSLVVIIPGAALTALLDVRLALASASAFVLAELLDYLVYTPIQRRSFLWAVLASAAAAAGLDSVWFLVVAGIPLAAALPGLLVAKLAVVVVCGPITYVLRGWLPQVAPPGRQKEQVRYGAAR